MRQNMGQMGVIDGRKEGRKENCSVFTDFISGLTH